MVLSLAYAVPETQTGPPLSANANPVHGPVGALVAAWPAEALTRQEFTVARQAAHGGGGEVLHGAEHRSRPEGEDRLSRICLPLARPSGLRYGPDPGPPTHATRRVLGGMDH